MPGFREDEEDTLFDDVARMADRMGLTGEKRSQYIDDHMEQGGYERVQTRESYAPIRKNEDDEDPGTRRRSSWFASDRGEGQADRGRGTRQGRGASSGRQYSDNDDRF